MCHVKLEGRVVKHPELIRMKFYISNNMIVTTVYGLNGQPNNFELIIASKLRLGAAFSDCFPTVKIVLYAGILYFLSLGA